MTARSPLLRLDGRLVYLQEFTTRDLKDARYLGWLRDLEVMRTVYRYEYLMPMRRVEIDKYANALMGSREDCFFAIYARSEGDFIGTLRIGHIDWRAGVGDVGILIGDRSYWGKGIATDAVATACAYAFQGLGLRKLTGGTASTNVAMRRCFERLGFKREAVLRKQLRIGGELVDHILYGIFADDIRAPKPPDGRGADAAPRRPRGQAAVAPRPDARRRARS